MNKKALMMLGIAAFVVSLPMLMGPSGGLPSRPRFQAVGVGVAPSSTAGSIKAGNSIQIERDTFPLLRFSRTSAPADQKHWDWFVSGDTTLTLRSVNDAFSATGTALQVTRSGTTIAAVDLFGTAVRSNNLLIPRNVFGAFSGIGSCAANASYQSSGISSCSRTGVGQYTVNFNITYTLAPTCVVSPAGTPYAASVQAATTTSVNIVTAVSNTGSVGDTGFNISCNGI